jgi:hypothetical protein
MTPTPESNEKMIKKNRMMINQLYGKVGPDNDAKFTRGNAKNKLMGGFESRDLVKRPDGTYGGSIVKPAKGLGKVKGPSRPK